jgi:imidazolonepropionase
MTVNAAYVVGATDRGRLAPGLRADVTLLDAPDWRYLAYHLAGDLVSVVVRAGTVAYRR